MHHTAFFLGSYEKSCRLSDVSRRYSGLAGLSNYSSTISPEARGDARYASVPDCKAKIGGRKEE